MSSFHLQIVSPDGMFFDGNVKQVSLRTIDGDVSILSGHIPYLTAIGAGECRVYLEDSTSPRRAACIGGFLNVTKEKCLISATTFEWAEDIDYDRAMNEKNHAENILSSENSDKRNKDIAKIKLKHANVRLQVVENNK